MNIAEAFAEFLQDQGFGSLGDSLRIGTVPLDAPSTCWWIITSGGSTVSQNHTGERRKQYLIQVFYRNVDATEVYNQLQALEELINSDSCTQLSGYDTIDIEATSFPTDQDVDAEDRTVGVVQVTITTYL